MSKFDIVGSFYECTFKLRALGKLFYCNLNNDWIELETNELNGLSSILFEVADEMDELTQALDNKATGGEV